MLLAESIHELLVHYVLGVVQIVFYHHTIVQSLLLSTLQIVVRSEVRYVLLQIAIGHTVVHPRWNSSALSFLRLEEVRITTLFK